MGKNKGAKFRFIKSSDSSPPVTLDMPPNLGMTSGKKLPLKPELSSREENVRKMPKKELVHLSEKELIEHKYLFEVYAVVRRFEVKQSVIEDQIRQLQDGRENPATVENLLLEYKAQIDGKSADGSSLEIDEMIRQLQGGRENPRIVEAIVKKLLLEYKAQIDDINAKKFDELLKLKREKKGEKKKVEKGGANT